MNGLVLHGPNLNLLGEREPEIYGSLTLGQINSRIRKRGRELRCSMKILQSNHEGVLIDWLHKYRTEADFVLLNAGAYTHTSLALRDAVASIGIPVWEIHLTNIRLREKFRRKSYLSEVVAGRVIGLGWKSYIVGLEKACAWIS